MTATMRRAPALLAALTALAAALAFAGPAAADDDDAATATFVAGEFIVELTPEADPAAVNQAVGGVAPPQRLAPTSPLWLFTLPATTDPEDGAGRIRNTDLVVGAQANVIAELPEFFGGKVRYWTDFGPPDPTAPASAATLDQPALGSSGLPAGADGAGTIVAVLDTGLEATHPAFAGAIAAGGRDLVDGDADPDEVADGIDSNANGVADEAFGHGTYVAGIVRIVAPGAAIVPIRIIDSDGVSSAWRILQGTDRAAAAGADVVNLSLGGGYLGELVDKALEQHEEAGMALVAAAGNSASTALRYPAAFDGVVGVTAIDGTTGLVATFANTGSWIEVAAPGVLVVSAFPGGRYATWGGTSAAAPVVAGALAAVREVMPMAAVDDVVDRLTSTAIADGLDNVSAYGRVDVAAAVDRARAG